MKGERVLIVEAVGMYWQVKHFLLRQGCIPLDVGWAMRNWLGKVGGCLKTRNARAGNISYKVWALLSKIPERGGNEVM